jgi:hypothetical protein
MSLEKQPTLQLQHDTIVMVALFLSVLGLYSSGWLYDLDWGGVSTVGAERVLRGEMPYRGFWTMYAPGHFYLLALLFRIFGTHLLVEVVAASAVCAAAACICYRLARNVVDRRIAALACTGIFVVALYNAGYVKRLGTYPPAISFILLAIHYTLLHYKRRRLGDLIAAGLATGAVVAFKHDVGAYTVIAIVSGLVSYHLLGSTMQPALGPSLLVKVAWYATAVGAIVLPLLGYFAVMAGSDLLRDLVIFPLTDFRFARPEAYPSLFPSGIYDASPVKMLNNLFNYLNFTIPFVLFLLGLVAVALAVQKRQPIYAAAGVTFATGFLLHYLAAHVQINTHIITLSVYAVFLGALFFTLVSGVSLPKRTWFMRWLVSGLIIGWSIALAAKPAYLTYQNWRGATFVLPLAKVSGFKVSPRQGHTLVTLASFVDTFIPPDQEVFVGLHRHDVVVIGDTMLYYILDRPNATRYQELHPAITDTSSVQQEIISNLRDKNIPFIILKNIFSDQTLEKIKEDFLRNLPYIGATDLDKFIRENYVVFQGVEQYQILGRKDIIKQSLDSIHKVDHSVIN